MNQTTPHPFIQVREGAIHRDDLGHPLPPNCGAVVEFSGRVRDSEDERPISAIDYEAFREMAIAELTRIGEEIIERHVLTDLVCVHRIGVVPVHQSAVYVRTAARHRKAAYEANMEFMERLKQHVPIWKHPVFHHIDGIS